jgi:hypothetical protein
MDEKRVGIGDATGMEDAPENQNEEFGRGDQEFGGGPGEEQYGEEPSMVGKEGVVFEGDAGQEEAAETAAQDRRVLGEAERSDEEAAREAATLVQDEEEGSAALAGNEEGSAAVARDKEETKE